jgi:hypothetical protein
MATWGDERTNHLLRLRRENAVSEAPSSHVALSFRSKLCIQPQVNWTLMRGA